MADLDKRVNIYVDADDAVNVLKEIRDALLETKENAEKAQKELKETSKSSNLLSKAGAAAGKGLKAVGNGLKYIGGALGIIALLQKLSEMFMSNEKIATAINKVFTTMQIVMNKVVDVVVELWNNMDHTKEVVKNLLKIAFTPLKLAVNSLILGFKTLALAWEKSPLGKKREDKIAELTEDITNLKENIKEAAVDGVEAIKGVVKNVGGMVKEFGEAGKKVVEEAKNFNLKQAQATANAVVEMRKNIGAELAKLQGDYEKLDAESEKFRQKRDDETKSFKERQEASDALLVNLELERKKLEEIANKKIRQAQLEKEANDNAETRTALAEAYAEKEAVNATIQGKISAQKAAQLGLIKEERDLKRDIAQGDFERYKLELEANANLIENEEEKLKKQKENIDIIYTKEKEFLDDKLELYNEGTIEYEQVLQERLNLDTQYGISVLDIDKQIRDEKEARDKEADKKEKERLQKEKDDFEKLQNAKIDMALTSIEAISQMDAAATQFSINLLDKKLKTGQINQETYDKKLAEIQEKAAKREKAFAVASTIINTAAAIMGIWKDFPKVDFGITAAIMSGVVGALGAAQVAAILATPTQTSSGSAPSGSVSTSTPSTGGGTAPNTSFTFDNTPQTQQQPVIKTYVLTKDVDNQQQLDRQIINNATI